MGGDEMVELEMWKRTRDRLDGKGRGTGGCQCWRSEKGMEGMEGMKAMAAKHERREKNEMRGTWGKIAGIPVIAGIPWRGEGGFA